MRYNNSDIDREIANTNSETHLVVVSQQPNNNHAATTHDQSPRITRVTETIPLTLDERTEIEAQDRIGWTHFIWGRTSNQFAPALQQYYSNNKLGKHSTPIR